MAAPPELSVELTAEERTTILDAIEEAIGSVLVNGEWSKPSLDDRSPALREPGATFVTLRRDRRLLGCIGTIEPVRPLLLDAVENGVNAAFRDPRLPPLSPADYEVMECKVSVLGPLHPLEVASLQELVSAVEPGVDGLLVTAPGHRGTFLPSVWEQLPTAPAFVEALWEKASLPLGAWPPGLRVERYRTVEFGRPGPRALPGRR
jgi:AmmeMemoRadiSam system protein A